MVRKQTGRKRIGVSLSLDINIAERLQELSMRERSDIVNNIFKDHLEDYIAGKGGISQQMDEQKIRSIIQAELSRRAGSNNTMFVRPPDDLPAPIPTNGAGAGEGEGDSLVEDLISGFTGMREKKK